MLLKIKDLFLLSHDLDESKYVTVLLLNRSQVDWAFATMSAASS